MKTTIKLTVEQINQIVKQQELEIDRKAEADKQAIEKKAAVDKAKLRSKYESYEVNIDEASSSPKVRARIDEVLLARLYKEGKTISQIAKELGSSYAGVKSAISRLGLAK